MTDEKLRTLIHILANDLKAFDHEVISLTNGVVSSLTVPTGLNTNAKYAIVDISGGDADQDYCRIWEDGSSPTASQGLKRFTESNFDIIGRDNLTNFRIFPNATGLTLNVQYYRD
jgi:hypothetical protein